jgi:hypothetical protein
LAPESLSESEKKLQQAATRHPVPEVARRSDFTAKYNEIHHVPRPHGDLLTMYLGHEFLLLLIHLCFTCSPFSDLLIYLSEQVPVKALLKAYQGHLASVNAVDFRSDLMGNPCHTQKTIQSAHFLLFRFPLQHNKRARILVFGIERWFGTVMLYPVD